VNIGIRAFSASAGAGKRTALMLLAATAWLPLISTAQEAELLDPEKAFRISTRALDERNVEVLFEIADGYYMYRDRFRFETASGRLLADVKLPKGKVKEDQFFGKTETYRREVRIRVPVAAADGTRGRVKLKVTSQGCADIGVCYVPLVQSVEVRLPSGSSNAPAAGMPPLSSWSNGLPRAPRKSTSPVPPGG
jgi:thiol:disulfide interchange protein DsbD